MCLGVVSETEELSQAEEGELGPLALVVVGLAVFWLKAGGSQQ